ncbi:MAG: hypothetical protein ABIQ12_04630 [Opitutaceae bacterium]
MRALVLCVLVCALTGCSPFNPFANEFTTHEPKMEDVVGDYVLTLQIMHHYEPTLDMTLKKRHSPPRIHLSGDGSFSFEDVPFFIDERDPARPRFSEFSNLKGRWTLGVVGGVGDGSGKIEKHWGIHLKGIPSSMGSLGFMGKRKPDRLIFTFSDPDSGEVMIFKKR